MRPSAGQLRFAFPLLAKGTGHTQALHTLRGQQSPEILAVP
jgi:hypothetical protein